MTAKKTAPSPPGIGGETKFAYLTLPSAAMKQKQGFRAMTGKQFATTYLGELKRMAKVLYSCGRDCGREIQCSVAIARELGLRLKRMAGHQGGWRERVRADGGLRCLPRA